MSYKMTRDVPYKLFRGRKIKDEAWNKLVETPLDFIADDFDAGIALLNDGTPRGCFLTQGGKEQAADWRCHFYVAGAQRILGKGSAYQCAKLYDCALLFFEKYRIRKSASQFNFSKLDAESDMNFEPAIGQYLASLENYLLTLGRLALPERDVNDELRKEKQRARSYKRTIAGTIEAFADRIEPYIFEIANQNDEMGHKIDALSSEIMALKSVITSKKDDL